MRTLLFIILTLSSFSPVNAQGNTYTVEVYQTCNGRICSVFPVSEGSAVAVARTRDNHTILLTAAHVVNNLPIGANPYKILISQRGRDKMVATLETKSDNIDIASLRVRQALPHAPIVLSSEGIVGTTFEMRGMLSGRYQVAQGRVTDVQGMGILSRGTWVHGGMSGGPFVSSEGVIGITVSKTSEGDVRAVSPEGMRRCLEATEKYTGKLYYAKSMDTPPKDSREYVPTPPSPEKSLPPSPPKNYDKDLEGISTLLTQLMRRMNEIENKNIILSKAVNTTINLQTEIMSRPSLSEDDVASILNVYLSQQEVGLTREEVLTLIQNNRQEIPIDFQKLNRTLQSIGDRLDKLEGPVTYAWIDSKSGKSLDEQKFPAKGPVVLDFNFLRKKMEAAVDR